MRKPALPPLNSLRSFEAAARHLSFKSAASELHVTPSAISQQLKQLGTARFRQPVTAWASRLRSSLNAC